MLLNLVCPIEIVCCVDWRTPISRTVPPSPFLHLVAKLVCIETRTKLLVYAFSYVHGRKMSSSAVVSVVQVVDELGALWGRLECLKPCRPQG